MEELTDYQRALALAEDAHEGQTRHLPEGGTEAYVEHPKRVAGLLNAMGHQQHPTLVVAVLHDVLEDTDVPWKVLYHEFGATVAAGVDLLSKESGPYSAKRYYARLALAPAWVRAVKVADRIDNLRGIVGVTGWDRGRITHYANAASTIREVADAGGGVDQRLLHALDTEIEKVRAYAEAVAA